MKYLYILFFTIFIPTCQAEEKIYKTHTLMSGTKEFNLDINKVHECKKILKEYVSTEQNIEKNIMLPDFNYKNDVVGARSYILINNNKYYICKKDGIIKFTHEMTLELKNNFKIK